MLPVTSRSCSLLSISTALPQGVFWQLLYTPIIFGSYYTYYNYRIYPNRGLGLYFLHDILYPASKWIWPLFGARPLFYTRVHATGHPMASLALWVVPDELTGYV